VVEGRRRGREELQDGRRGQREERERGASGGVGGIGGVALQAKHAREKRGGTYTKHPLRRTTGHDGHRELGKIVHLSFLRLEVPYVVFPLVGTNHQHAL
jgi:hypothetical protein